MNKPLVVLSLFDGMSCGQIALERAGIPIKAYYASEIDKYAITVTQKNYPNTVQLGNIENWKEWDIPVPDLIIAGSPCQGFSNAGHGLNFDDPRSKLFFVFCDILAFYAGKNPNLKYLLENVKMKATWKDIITDCMKVKPVLINSALVSAQNRERLYWMNWTVEQPEDRGIYLRDIIESEPVNNDLLKNSGHNCIEVGNLYPSNGMAGRIYSVEGKSPSLRTATGGNHMPKILIVPEATKKGYVEIYPNEGVDLTFPKSKTRRGRRMEDKSNALLTSVQDLNWYDGYNYRKLTVLECERLQTVPEGYTEGVSNTQRYKMLGNGWTIDVIAHLFKALISAP